MSRPDRTSADATSGECHAEPTEEELDAMSRDELVDTRHRRATASTSPTGASAAVAGHPRREASRAARRVLVRAGRRWRASRLSVVFLFWPWEYKGRGEDGSGLYSLSTPLFGLLLGIARAGHRYRASVQIRKKFIPHEIVHPGPSRRPVRPEVERRTLVAELQDALETSTLRSSQDDHPDRRARRRRARSRRAAGRSSAA